MRGITLSIPAGRITAIVGASGAGKSTLADLLLGLADTASGQSRRRPPLDGPDAGWRRSIGYVSQDVFLLHDTIRANLAWARPEASDRRCGRRSRAAAADSFARAREGLDAIVGDRGVSFPGENVSGWRLPVRC